MKTIAIGIAGVVALIGGTLMSGAHAADIATKIPLKAPSPVAPPCNWCGWYVGINGGGAWGRTDPTLNTPIPNGYFSAGNVPAVEAAGSQSFNNSGGLAGAQIGYLTEFNSVVLGIEAGFDWMGVTGSSTTTHLYPVQSCITANCAFTVSDSAKTDWLFTLLGRAGVDFGNWYPYIIGGLAVADAKYSVVFSDNNGPGFGTAGSFSAVKAGAAIGGGLEWKWNNHWSVRGEYLYVTFDGPSGSTPNISGASSALTVSERFKENIGRAALDYKF